MGRYPALILAGDKRSEYGAAGATAIQAGQPHAMIQDSRESVGQPLQTAMEQGQSASGDWFGTKMLGKNGSFARPESIRSTMKGSSQSGRTRIRSRVIRRRSSTGASPALTSDDLPVPDSPNSTTRRLSRIFASMASTSASRPKKDRKSTRLNSSHLG